MAILGALVGGAIGAFGKKPKVPDFREVAPDLVQSNTITGNLRNFEEIAALATRTDYFNQSQLEALLDRVLPGARQQIQKNISSQLRGEIPVDVGRAIQRFTAGRTSGALTRGSGFAGNVTARDLGLTSLDLIDRGLSSAESWLQQASAPRMDVTSMFFTPQQRLAFEVQERDARFQRDLLAAGVKAAPDPATAALGQEIDRFFNTAASVGMMFAGGGGIGGLGGGAAGAAGGAGLKGGGLGFGGGGLTRSSGS